ncbi:MAG TPA: hypothetical protein VFW83_05910 [Bryobacteraceae bacterium]|nr:hypothetical protein [Bryobacteraceae bacterium]
MATPADAFISLLEVLDRMEIPYLVGSSVASAVHGISRPTMDADIVADLRRDQVDEFVGLLQSSFYADASTIKDALDRRRSFNLIHFQSTFKIDIFPLHQDDYSRTSFARRRFEESRSLGSEPIECAIATPEDTILRKLEWYRAGGETFERQWNDLRGVLKVSGDQLDREYLRRWAEYLKIGDLLERLLAEE